MPAALEAGTLPDALADVTREWSELNGIPADVTVTGNVIALHPEIEVALLRIAQEALANVARHAGATRAGLTLSFIGDVVTLDVRDDGVGFSVPEADAGESPAGIRPERHAPAGRPRRRIARDRVGARRRHGAVGARPGDRRQLIGGSCSMSPIRLMIVDDHPVVRDGLRGMLAGDPDLDVVGDASDGAEALDLVDSLRPDVILMDLRMPRLGGAAAIKALAERGSEAKVLVLTTYDTDRDVVPALEAGATGYLLKDAPRDELVRAIHAAARGESVLAPSVATRLVSQLRSPEHEALSDRELEVLTLIAQGETNARRRGAPLHLRGDRQDAPAPHLREARRQRPCRGRRDRLRARPPRPPPRLSRALRVDPLAQPGGQQPAARDEGDRLSGSRARPRPATSAVSSVGPQALDSLVRAKYRSKKAPCWPPLPGDDGRRASPMTR